MASSRVTSVIREFAALAAYIAAVLTLAGGAIALCAPLTVHLVH